MSEIQAWRRETHLALGGSRAIRRKASRTDRSTHDEPFTEIYFIADDRGRVKIGESANPLARLRSLQTASACRLTLLASSPAFVEVERVLHRRFAGDRLSGEWFSLSTEIQAFVDRVTAGLNLNTECLGRLVSVPPTDSAPVEV